MSEITVDTTQEDLEKQLLMETDPKKMQQIVDIFNLNLKKKNVVRASKISELQDNIIRQMGDRVSRRANDFSNKDLLDYYKAAQDTLMKQEVASELPQINFTDNSTQENVNITIGNGELTIDRRKKVLDVVNAIMKKSETKQEEVAENVIDGEFDELESKEETSNEQ